MSNLVVAPKQSIVKRITVNQLGAAAVVGFTAYATGCILVWHDDEECSKQELLVELYGAAYETWKWYMGLGPKPTIKIGTESNGQRRRLR